MKTNNLLTMLLYGLLGILILAAGYKACEMQKEKKRQALEEAELQKTLRDMGLTDSDTTSTGSAYRAGSDSTGLSTTTAAPTTTAPTTTKTGITQTAPVTTTNQPKAVTKAPPTATQPTAPTAVKPTITTKPTTTKGVAKTPKVAGPGNGRWAVRAGTFSSMAGARTRLEQVIRAGYPNAEISKTSSGMAAVVVYRSDNKTNAINVVDKLEEKGIDAAVFDRSKN